MRRVSIVAAVFVIATPLGHAAASINVKTAADLQAALDSAQPGDTILLDAGATYVGHFRLPARMGSDTRAITIQTAGPDASPPGRRITPAAAPKLAKLRSPDGEPVLQTAPGAKFWRVQLLEFQANADPASDIITLGDGSNAQNTLTNIPSDITVDRVYVHGDPVRGQKRGIALNSVRTTVSNSYISDIKTVGQDSQALGGWNGPGDYTIENNYLEAAGENVMFGGADPSILNLVPTHIVIRGNTLSKPDGWRGSQWQVKNLFELKNAIDVTVDSNILEHNWTAAQSGFGIVLTVRNQDGGCPWCELRQVLFTHNVIRDIDAGIDILGYDDQHPSRQTSNIVFRDNVFDGVNKGYFLLMSHTPKDVTFDHNTIIASTYSGLVEIGGTVDGSFTFTNNLAPIGQYGIASDGMGLGTNAIRASFPGAQIAGNVLAGAQSNMYPAGNFFPSLQDLQSQFVDFAAHDYRLKPSSRWAHAGTDGKDPGANGINGAPIPPLAPRR